MKVINGTNVLPSGEFNVNNTNRYISMDEFTKTYAHFAVEADDIVVVSSGSIGKVSRVRQEQLPLMMNTSVIRFHAHDPQILDDDFLFAFLRSPLFQAQVHSFAIGAAQLNFGPRHIKQMQIPLPSMAVQRKIASVLSAYDNRIENNTRRISLLEEMAKRIYCEWFVEFRYPGRDYASISDSDLDAIPPGWEWRELHDVVELAYGKALKADDRRPGLVPVFGSGGVVGLHDTALVDGPGIVVGRKGTVGAVHWSDTRFFPIDTTYFVRTKLPLTYVYFALQNLDFLDSHAAVPGLSRAQAYGLPFMVPDGHTLATFDDYMKPMFTLNQRLREASEALAKARDLLLPRLISGEIDAEDLDIEIAEFAA